MYVPYCINFLLIEYLSVHLEVHGHDCSVVLECIKCKKRAKESSTTSQYTSTRPDDQIANLNSLSRAEQTREPDLFKKR